ncbi:MAG: cellulase family glycosylhydrolase [Polyangiaceae bacterium]|nr:cellulase family glycosylhydrolase [Polyangiaceae bacterium]
MSARGGLLLAIALVAACGGSDEAAPPSAPVVTTAPCADPPSAGRPLGVRCGHLVDERGRVVVLRGVNARVEGLFDVTFSDGRAPLEPIPPFTGADAAAMRDWGFDSLRLPINWSAIEPTETGGFDEGYLDRVAAVVDAAAAAGLLVLIDLHQDAYSKEFGEDGAPLWAIVPAPRPEELLGGPLHDLDARRRSTPVLAAFNTFFGASADGERLRGRFVAMASHVARRFSGHPAVMGVEIFNEPLGSMEALRRFYDLAYPALRQAAPDKVFVFEPDSLLRNNADSWSLPDTPLGPMAAYAPHYYKFAFTATEAVRQAMTKDKLALQIESARDEADAWGAALFATEWGYDPRGTRAAEYFTWQSELHEQTFSSTAFWLWKEQSQGSWGCFDYDAATGAFSPRDDVRRWLARARAKAVAGWPTAQSFDRASGVYSLTFTADPTMTGPTVIAVAPALGAPLELTCDGVAVAVAQAENGDVELACGHGTSSAHTITMRLAPLP